jgi:uncharacterized protein YdeI (YjbR/CyaY-like superfamily)
MTDSVAFADRATWERWLRSHHDDTPGGVWLRLAKKGSDGLAYPEALLGALAWGWIDAQKKSLDDGFWLQRFTPRRPKGGWSKLNRAKAEELIARGEMAAPGKAEVERAKADGRWERAYDGARAATVPDDLAVALAAKPKAKKFFATLDGANRYAVLYRIQTAKKPETRARRITTLVAMLERGEKIHERS